tara:strand:+ start:3242 stop:3901 length:660 start_codon:yes stop_codon:yes gene_type:complete
MALIPLTYKLDWYDPSQPGGIISTVNNNANTATSFDTQYTMQDIIDTVTGSGGVVTGSGTTNSLTKWKAPVGSGEIEDSSMVEESGEIICQADFRVDGNNFDVESTKLNMTQGGIYLLGSIDTSTGISFTHPAGGASADVYMHFAGAVQGSRFVISRQATGGAEIELESDGDINLNRTGNGGVLIGGLGNYADDAAAAAGGVPINGLYRNGNVIQIRII